MAQTDFDFADIGEAASRFRRGSGARTTAHPRNHPERHGVDYRLDDFVLDPAKRGIHAANIGAAITGSGMTLSIEQASTFTVDVLDTDRGLLRSRLLTGWGWGENDERDEQHWILNGRKVAATIGDLDLLLVKLAKAEDTLTLTFEEEAVFKLRRQRGARKAQRFDSGQGVTRAEFVASLCREADVEFYIPEIHKHPKVVKPEETPGVTTKVTGAERRAKGKKGFDRSAGITVKHVKASRQQIDILQRALDIGDRVGAPRVAMLAAICAMTAESTVSYVVNSSGYGGPFQGQVNTGGHYFKATDVEAEAWHFFKGGKGFQHGGAIALARQGKKPGEIADLVESGGAGARFYGKWLSEARRTLAAFSPGFAARGGGLGASVSVTTQKPYNFERGRRESSWDAIQRLASEVQWRAFVRKGVLWYVSEEYLFNQAPQVVLRERQGVDSIDFDVDQNARDGVAEITATARSRRWTTLPGMVAVARGVGPAEGRWIVASIERESLNVRDDNVTITAHKPMPTKPEPAAETETQTFSLTGKNAEAAAGGKIRRQQIRGMSPKHIIDNFVLPVARHHHIHVTPASVTAANHRHTHLGSASDHAGPPNYKWAADMSNGTHPTPQMDGLARDLAKMFGIPWDGSGLISHNGYGFRFQLIYRFTSAQAGNHYNHVHFGIRKL